MDLLSLSTPLNTISKSPIRNPRFPSISSYPNPNPNPRCSYSPRNSLQFHQSTTPSPNNVANPFHNLGLGYGGATVANSPQTQGSAMRAAEADVMGMLLRERIVFLGSEIEDFVADAIISQLLLLDAKDHTKDIRLFINSPGGSLSATMAIHDVVKLIRADVSTVALGIAASTASIILGAGTKGKRLAMPNARIMIHQPLGGASGRAADVEIQAREIMTNKENVTRIISEFTGRPYEQVEKDIDRDRYMSPIEAVEYGLLDGVIDRDTIIPLQPVPDKVVATINSVEIMKDPVKFLKPEIPDDEIY